MADDRDLQFIVLKFDNVSRSSQTKLQMGRKLIKYNQRFILYCPTVPILLYTSYKLSKY